MKKTAILPAVLLLVLAAALPAGGQKEQAKSSAPVEVTWLAHPVHWTIAGEGELAQRFSKDHPNIKIVPALYGVDVIREKFLVAVSSKSSDFDIFSMDNQLFRKDWGKDIFLDLNSRTREIADFADFSPGYLGIWTALDGTLCALPIRSGLCTSLFRSDLVEAGGLANPQEYPYTIEKFLQNAQKMTKDTNGDGTPDIYGFVFKGKQGSQIVDDFETWSYIFGGRILDPNTRQVTVNSPACVEAVQFILDLMYKYKVVSPGVLSYTSQEEIALIQEGKVAHSAHWWNYLPQYENTEKSKVVGKMKVGYLPEKPGVSLGYGHGGGWAYGINRFSKHSDEAWEWIKFVTNKENQVYALQKGNGPTRVSVFASPEFKKVYGEKGAAIVAHYYSKIVFPPSIPEWNEIRLAISRELSLAYTREKTPQQALDDAAKTIRQLLGQK
jgi:multiple sugar transport system substrate-binding protein